MVDMKVGIVAYRFDHYSPVRNVVGIVPGIQYIKAKDLFARVNASAHALNRLAKREIISTFDLNNQFYDLNFNKVDILHLFNGISYGNTPWVSTFETVLPRFRSVVQVARLDATALQRDRKLHRAMDALAGPHCKCLIAMSACAAQIQTELLAKFDRHKEDVQNKINVMQPPQDLLVLRFEDKQVDLDGRIRFMFVGSAFFRKGGREIVDTLHKLRDQHHYDIELIIISNFQSDGYAVPVTSEMIERIKAFIRDNQDWVKYYPQLPNTEVLELMKKAHIGLLPTYADTYGYSVLEFQAAGCPVISTNVRALPEMNDNEMGWMIEVPKNHLGEAFYATESDRMSLSEAICIGLEKAVHEIFTDRSIILQKAGKSILSIEHSHSRIDFATRMNNIYLDALNRT